MKPFMLFAYDTYYPSGGISDLRGSYDSISEAREAFETGFDNGSWVEKCDHYQIVSHATMEAVDIGVRGHFFPDDDE